MTKIALVTPILPVPHDQARGRFIYETARSLSHVAEVRVFFMQQRYPRILSFLPRSAVYGEVDPDYRLADLDMESLSYPALPVVSRPLNGILGGNVLTPRVRAFEPDVVLGYWVYPEGNSALRTACCLNVPCVVGALGSDIHVRSGVSAIMTRRTIAGVDALLTVSENMRQTAIADYRARPDRVFTVVNGFNTSVFKVRSKSDARSELGIPPDVRLLVFVGRFVEAKGLRELVTAFRQLQADQPLLRLALVGDGVMREKLNEIIDSEGLRGCVLLPGGLVPERVAKWIAAADVLTLPSWSEGYPNVVVEAIACGRPVVATDVGGTREIINDQNGILIPARSPSALAAALSDALARSWNADQIAATIRRSWDDVAAETLAICDRAIQWRTESARVAPVGRVVG